MLNGRLYRVAFVPFALVLAVAAFSLVARTSPLTSPLVPDAFEGAPALAELKRMAAEFPSRQPGSPGDDAFAARIARTLKGLGAPGHGGFRVTTHQFQAQTVDGERTLSTVLAQRAGSSGGPPIVLVAHRDARGAGGSSSEAELSGTAALIELARVFAARETQRTIVLVSTSGGSGGGAGALDFASEAETSSQSSPQAGIDAAIVLGDVAGVRRGKPFVVPYSDAFGSASEQLQRTVSSAIAQNLGANPGAPSTLDQLAHLAFPLATGEEGALNERGVPAVLVQVSGEGEAEASPRAGGAVSAEELEGFGRAVLSAVDALDTAPDLAAARQTGLVIGRQVLGEWVLRLLLATLLIPPLLLLADGYARLRRRRGASGDRAMIRGLEWTGLCALPFFAAALFAKALGWLGALPAPPLPVQASALSLGNGSAVRGVLAVGLALGLCWLTWPRAVRWLGLRTRPDDDGAGLAMLTVLLVVAIVVWLSNPYATLLVVGALHLWLLLVSPRTRPPRPAALALVGLALVPPALLIAFYASALGVGLGGIAWDAVLLLTGGHLGFAAIVLWSLGCGCAVAAALLATAPEAELGDEPLDAGTPLRIRGPLSYAGPGSLGGTESALRR
ncbi:MAG: M28 family peptidase [Solirubrobacteraceae bacterium]